MALERYLDPYEEAVQAALPESFRQMRNPTSGLVSGALEDQTSQSGRAVRSGLERFGALAPALAGAGLNLVSEGAGDGLLRSAGETMQSAAERGPDIQSWDQVQGAGDALAYARNMALGALPDVGLALGTAGIGGAVAKGVARRGLTRAIEGAATRNAIRRAGASEVDDVARAIVSPAGQSARRGFTPATADAGRTFADDVARLTPRAQARMRASDGYYAAGRAGQAAGAWAGNYPPTVAASVMGAPDADGNMVGGLIGADQGDTARILLGDAGAAALGALPEYAILGRVGGRAVEQAIAQNAQRIWPRVAREAAKQGGIGAGAGLAQTVAQLATHKWVDDNVDLLSPAAFSQYLDATIAGGMIGGGLGGGIEGVNAGLGRALGAGEQGRALADGGAREQLRSGLAKLAEARRKATSRARGAVDNLFRRGEGPEPGQPMPTGGPPPDGTPPAGGGGGAAAVGRAAASAQQMFTEAFHAINDSLTTPEGRAAWANATRDFGAKAKGAVDRSTVADLLRDLTRGYNETRSRITDAGEQGRLKKAYDGFVSNYLTDNVPEQATDTFQRNAQTLNDEVEFDATIDLALREIDERNRAFEDGASPMLETNSKVGLFRSQWQNMAASMLPENSPFRGTAAFTDAMGNVRTRNAARDLRAVAEVGEKLLTGDSNLTPEDVAALSSLEQIHPGLAAQWKTFYAKNAGMIQAVRRLRDDSPDDRPTEALAGETDDGTIMSDAFARAREEKALNRPLEVDSPDQIDTGSGEGPGAVRVRAAREDNAPRSDLREQMLAEQDPARRTELQAQYRDSILNSNAVFKTANTAKARALYAEKDASPATVRLEPEVREPPASYRAWAERQRATGGDAAYEAAMQRWYNDPANTSPRLVELANLMRRHEGSRSALTGDDMTPFEMLQGALADLELAGIPYDRSSIKAGPLGKDRNGRDFGRITEEQAQMLRQTRNELGDGFTVGSFADPAARAARRAADAEVTGLLRDYIAATERSDRAAAGAARSAMFERGVTPARLRDMVARRAELDNEPIDPSREKTMGADEVDSGIPDDGRALVTRRPPPTERTPEGENISSQRGVAAVDYSTPYESDVNRARKAARTYKNAKGEVVTEGDVAARNERVYELGLKVGRDDIERQYRASNNSRRRAQLLKQLEDPNDGTLAYKYARRAIRGEFDTAKVREQKADNAGEQRVSVEGARRERVRTTRDENNQPYPPSKKRPGAEKSGGADGWYAYVMKRRNERAPKQPSQSDHVDLLLGKYDERIRGRDGGLIDKGQLTHAEGKYIAALREAAQDAGEGNKIRRALDTFDETRNAGKETRGVSADRVFPEGDTPEARSFARRDAEKRDARANAERSTPPGKRGKPKPEQFVKERQPSNRKAPPKNRPRTEAEQADFDNRVAASSRAVEDRNRRSTTRSEVFAHPNDGRISAIEARIRGLQEGLAAAESKTARAWHENRIGKLERQRGRLLEERELDAFNNENRAGTRALSPEDVAGPLNKREPARVPEGGHDAAASVVDLRFTPRSLRELAKETSKRIAAQARRDAGRARRAEAGTDPRRWNSPESSSAERFVKFAQRETGRRTPNKPKRTEKSDDERRAERAAEIAEDVRNKVTLEDDAAIDAGVDAATRPSGPHDHAAETRAVNALLKRMGFKDRLTVEAHTAKPRNGQYVPGERVIRLGDNLHGGERLEVLGHEIGHHVLRAELARIMGVDLDHFANLPRTDVFNLLKEHAPDLHKSIIKDFEAWKADNNAPGNSALDARLSRSMYYRSKRIRETASAEKSSKKVGDLSDDAYNLVFDFDEFVADQVARALTHSAAKSPAAKFFKGLADKLKLVYEKLFTARGKTGFAPAPSVDAWVRSMFDRTTLSVSEALGEPVPKATARAGVEAAANVHAALNTPPPPGGTPPGGTVPPLPPKGLRQLIKFIRTRLSPDERLILEKALGNGRLSDTGRMNRHLARVYADQPGALRAMRDPAHGMEAKIALAYMAWEAGALKAGPHGGDVLHGISSDLFAIANLASDSDFALRIFEDIASGKIEAARAEGTPYDVRAQFAAERGTPQVVLNKATAVGRAVQRAIGKVLDANITRMRDTGVPALRQVAALLQRHSGEGGSDVGLTLSVVHTTDRFLRRAANIFSELKGEDAAQVLSALQQRDDALATSDAAKSAVAAARAMFEDLHNYGVGTGVLGADQKIDRYWPVVMDLRSDSAERTLRNMLGDPKFEQRIREVMGVYDEKAGKRKPSQAPMKDLIEDMIKTAYGPSGGLINEGTKLTTAKFRAQGHRMFGFIYELGNVDDIKRFASLQNHDIQHVVSGYIVPLVKTAERARRFGAKDAKLDKLLATARAQGATPDDLAHAQFAVDAATGNAGLNGSPVLRKLFGDGVANRVASARDVIGWLQAYQNARLLPLAVLSSLADPMGIGVRAGGDIGVAWKGIKLGLKSVFHKATREELQRMMDVLGSAGDFVTYDILQSNFSGSASSGTARKVNDWIFRANGLAGWTKATRYMALVSAHHFLNKHGGGANAKSIRYLDELGLRPGDVRMDAATRRVALLDEAERNSASAAERARDDRVRTALMRFVDEAVLRPTSQQAPSWFADPYMGLITQYKHFAYAINDQIIRRIGTELRDANFAVLAPTLAYLPIIVMAEMTRGAIQYGTGGNPNRDDWGPTEYVGLAAERSGLLGPRYSFMDAAHRDRQYGNTFGASFLGPTAQQGVEAWRTLNGRRDAGKTFENALPGSALYKRWNDGIGSGSEAT